MTEYTCDSFRFFNLFPVYFGGKGTQADMAAVQDRSGCDGGLPVAVGTLIQPVGQAATVFVPAFRANEPIRPSLCGQIVPTTFLSSEPVQKLTQGHPLLP